MTPPAAFDRRRRQRRIAWTVFSTIVTVASIAALVVWLTDTPAQAVATARATRADVSTSISASGTVVDGTTTAVTTSGSAQVTAIDGTPVSSSKTAGAASSARTITVRSVDVAVGQAVTAGQQLATVADATGTVTAVTAPIAGTVRTVSAVVGASDTLVATIGSGGVTTAVDVDEHRIPSVAEGQHVDLDIGNGWVDVTGSVTSIGQTAESSSGVTRYQVLIAPASLPAAARIGMSVGATITLQDHEHVVTVPLSAVTTAHGATFVTTVDDQGTQHQRDVAVGIVGATRVEVTRGLEVGDRVVTGVSGSVPSETALPGPTS